MWKTLLKTVENRVAIGFSGAFAVEKAVEKCKTLFLEIIFDLR